MKYDSVIFDLDGTLWDAVDGVIETWKIILKKHPEIERDEITRKDLEVGMGLLAADIGKGLFPKETSEVQLKLMKECSVEECRYLAENGGKIYDNLEDTLKVLKDKGIKLFIVSNCQDGYIEAFLKAHNMESYFIDSECPGRTGKNKSENIKLIVERNNLKKPVYVGDTITDANSAKEAGVPFIFASYGFGDVKDYEYSIGNFKELVDIIR